MSNYCMIETAFDNKEELGKVTSKLLGNKLVSSCQVVRSDSKWRWKDELEGSKEYLLFMKTKKDLAKDVFEAIKSIHSYDCFEFAVFELTSCNEEYLKWIEEETK